MFSLFSFVYVLFGIQSVHYGLPSPFTRSNAQVPSRTVGCSDGNHIVSQRISCRNKRESLFSEQFCKVKLKRSARLEQYGMKCHGGCNNTSGWGRGITTISQQLFTSPAGNALSSGRHYNDRTSMTNTKYLQTFHQYPPEHHRLRGYVREIKRGVFKDQPDTQK